MKKILSMLLSLALLSQPLNVFSEEIKTKAQTHKEILLENTESEAHIPVSLTLKHDSTNIINDVIVTKKGDKFKLSAYDENGDQTPVTWKNTSYGGGGVTLDENTGEIEVTSDIYSSSTSYLYFTATSTLDETLTAEITVRLTGYLMSEYQKSQTVALSSDGQSAKTVSLTAGHKGHNIWSYNTPDKVAELTQDPGNDNTIKFNVFRPGIIDVSFALDINEELSDTATIEVTGVAVEDADGNRGKTYLSISVDNPTPTAQLTAYVSDGRSISAWSSADESIATVDENGLVTANSVGSTIISATDSEGVAGGIKVVVESEDIPYFENLQFLSNAIKDYSTAYVFSPTKTEYDLEIKTYSTTKLTLQNTTLYDTTKYTATAEYTDIDGEKQTVNINSGAITYLDKIPFDESIVTITIQDKTNSENKTVYTFHITRPRDTTKTVKSNGIVLVPDGRNLSSAKYNGYTEGTMFKLTENGEIKTGWGTNPDTGVSSSHYSYKCYTLNDLENFALKITGNTVYEHLRYSSDGENWSELPIGGGTTEILSFSEGENTVSVTVQIIDDKTYTDNTRAGNDGFADCTPTEYTVIIEKTDSENTQILSATTDSGDWYPCLFNKDQYAYTIVVPKDVSEKTLTYTIPEGTTVKLGTTEQTPVDGVYTLPLTTSQKTLTVISRDGKISNTYNFKLQKKSDGYPDKVIDFLCINSQYTNGGYGTSPWTTLSGGSVSLGNFGGYITYYYEDSLTDNPNNKYGIDFYVYGNANKDTSTSTKTSFFEPAQCWVSEDGEEWYALAGSAHYDEGVAHNYSITYKKTASGKTSWIDSLGNTNNGTSFAGTYPSADIYTMNDLAKSDTITLSGIALPARNGGIAISGIATDAYPIKWGYADCFVNGTKGADVNPYTDNTNFDLQANGFDLKWAVDSDGNPIDISGKEFHYVKLVTASNLWHSSFGDKSPEIAGVVKTTAQNEAVGKTDAPDGVTITDGADTKIINFSEEENIYTIDVGDMKYVSISVNGADESDNIYINNERITYNGSANGFKITKESGEKLIRVLIQNGDKEPLIYLLKITGNTSESTDLIEGIKLNVNGNSRTADTTDGDVYTASVGYRISSIGIIPIANDSVNITVNNEEINDSYSLSSGENIFTVTGEKDGITHTVTLKITKDSPPSSGGNITVYFTLLGDDAHGESDDVHTLTNGGLTTWISKKSISVKTPATVLDVFEKALGTEYTFVNADGNYISEINGLKEFTNGANSGWMYSINGKHSGKGVAEQSVKNGDKIIFHYSDDYTLEDDSTVQTPDNSTDNTTVSTGGSSGKSNTKKESLLIPQTVVTHQLPFTDISNHWAYDAIKYVHDNSIMQGIGKKEFAPNENMTRAMLVTVLYRLDKAENTASENKFTDVPDGQWYTDAVTWASANGIVSGISETEFAPNDNITREQMAAIIYRYTKIKGYNIDNMSDLSSFEDISDVSEWAIDALKWANAAGLINGTTDKTLSPKANATRAQIAVILMQFCEKVMEEN